MGYCICKQPNGKYCRFSTHCDTLTHYNMTEEDYVQFKMEQARVEAINTIRNNVYPFKDILSDFYPSTETKESFIEKLKEMGASQEQINHILNGDY